MCERECLFLFHSKTPKLIRIKLTVSNNILASSREQHIGYFYPDSSVQCIYRYQHTAMKKMKSKLKTRVQNEFLLCSLDKGHLSKIQPLDESLYETSCFEGL